MAPTAICISPVAISPLPYISPGGAVSLFTTHNNNFAAAFDSQAQPSIVRHRYRSTSPVRRSRPTPTITVPFEFHRDILHATWGHITKFGSTDIEPEGVLNTSVNRLFLAIIDPVEHTPLPPPR